MDYTSILNPTNIEWVASAGTFVQNGDSVVYNPNHYRGTRILDGVSITYTAPQNPGAYSLTIGVHGYSESKSSTAIIVLPPGLYLQSSAYDGILGNNWVVENGCFSPYIGKYQAAQAGIPTDELVWTAIGGTLDLQPDGTYTFTGDPATQNQSITIMQKNNPSVSITVPACAIGG